MRCCHCGNQITQDDINKGLAQKIFGVISHVVCDNEQLGKQEKLVRYVKREEMI